MPRDTLLTVDFSYQVYRATAVNQRLECDGTFTGGLYGFFVWLGKAVRETRATRLAICLDSKPYLRSKAYPAYKNLRPSAGPGTELSTKYELSKRLILEALFSIGAPIYALEGFEADDMAAGLAARYRHRLERIYMATNDSDAYQCLEWDVVAIYRTHINEVVNRRTLLRDLGLTPQQYTLATALMGTHNNVEGIPNVGPVTAFRVAKDPAQLRIMRGKWADLIDRNMELIKLPHPALPAAACILDEPARQFDPRDLYKALHVWDIDVTESMVRAFQQTAV